MKHRLLLLFMIAACTGGGPKAGAPMPAGDGPDDLASADPAPPDMTQGLTFAGAHTAKASPSAIQLSWFSAQDPGTPADHIVYLVYRATRPGGEDLSKPTYTTPPGTFQYTIPALPQSTTFYFVVRAKNGAGKIDENTAEVSATTPVEVDAQAPAFAGATMAEARSSTSLNLSWAPAMDDYAPQGDLVYLIYQADTTGGQNLLAPTYVTFPGSTSQLISGLTPATTFHFVVRALDLAGNLDANQVEVSGTTNALSFSIDVMQDVVLAHCLGSRCHAGKTPMAMLDLSTPAKAYAALVGVKSQGCGMVNRVEPGSADTSYLVSKLVGAGACFVGGRMPLGGTPLSAEEMLKIRGWINGGALNN